MRTRVLLTRRSTLTQHSTTSFTQMEKQKAVFNELVSHITELCFDKCVPKPGGKLDSSEQACLSSCTLRFLESNQVVLQRLQRSK